MTGRMFTGVVHSRWDLPLSLGVGGVVSHLDVKLGQRVAADQVLIRLDDRPQALEAKRREVIWKDDTELKTASEQLAILGPLCKDAKALYDQNGSISREDLAKLQLEKVQTEGQMAQLQVQKQREHIEYLAAEEQRRLRRLVAPVAGVVTRINTDVGEWVKPGEPLLRLVNDAKVVLYVNVPEAAAHNLSPGMKLPVLIKGARGELSLPGRISFVSPTADPASGLVQVRVDFSNRDGKVRPGVKGRIRLSERP